MTGNAVLMDDAELNLVSGGWKWRNVGAEELAELGIDDVVKFHCETFFGKAYYETYRGRDGNGNPVWKHIGLDDMLDFVATKYGEDSNVSKALHAYCYHISWRDEWKELGF